MGYWLFLIMMFMLILIMLSAAIYARTKGDKENDLFPSSIICACLCTIMVIPFAADIPNALAGGETLYTDSFPSVSTMQFVSLVFTDHEKLITLWAYDPDDYEQNTGYKITYTKFTKCILDIEEAGN